VLASPLLLAVAPLPGVGPTAAHACGCFTSTTVASPVVQAGEKILFAQQNGTITMQVQVQYSGPASDFGWLLPLPAVPTDSSGNQGIDVGSQEVFDALSRTTQPTYSLTTIPCGSNNNGPSLSCASANYAAGSPAPDSAGMGAMTPLVTQSSVGPYNFAILKADDKTAMLGWLMMNGYVVPNGTDAAVAPYIRPGGYFLALRLKSGESTGDLQPVVLHYQSDLPMVPINLTSASSAPSLGVLIWVLGPSRAIPRNYFDTVIDDAQLDWLNSVQNYSTVVAKAVREVNGHHGFVTEFSGSSSVMQGTLGSPDRFAFLDTQGLSTQKDPVTFVQALLSPSQFDVAPAGFALNGQLTAILSSYIPEPAALSSNGITLGDYYNNINFYLNQDRAQNPQKYADIAMALANFNPAMLVSDLKTRIVTPTLAAQTLFASASLPTLTRLYTVMAPDDMNLDPVFSFNPDLPPVPKDHSATLYQACPKDGYPQAQVTTESGWKVSLPGGSSGVYPTLAVPYAQRIQTLMDTGAPTVTVDNSNTIQSSLAAAGPGAQGCTSLSDGRRRPGPGLFGLALLSLGLVLLRRRQLRSRG
jgi:hypothetical protein